MSTYYGPGTVLGPVPVPVLYLKQPWRARGGMNAWMREPWAGRGGLRPGEAQRVNHDGLAGSSWGGAEAPDSEGT